MSQPIYELTQVKQEVVWLVGNELREGFFQYDEQRQKEALINLSILFADIYEIPVPELLFSERLHCAGIVLETIDLIVLKEPELLKFLWQFRRYSFKYVDVDSELPPLQDALAFSIRTLKLASPSIFNRLVKMGGIRVLVWDDLLEMAVDNPDYSAFDVKACTTAVHKISSEF